MSSNKQINNLLNTNKLFHEWVSTTNLKNFFSDNICFENFSLWWITRIIDKDNVNVKENRWYYDLNSVLAKKKNKIREFSWSIFFIKLIKNFFKNILWISYFKVMNLFLGKNIDKNKYDNCFHSFDIQINKYNDSNIDKIYGYAPFKIKKKKNFFLISSRTKKFKIFVDKLINDHYVVNSYLSYSSFFKIYFVVFVNLFKTLKYMKLNNGLFIIKKINCTKVLKPLLINSFCGSIQDSLIQALSIQSFLKRNKIKKLICYGEFNPGFRSVYYFAKKINYPIKIVAIQHGYANENLLFFSHKKKDFDIKKKQGRLCSPMPDQYLVKGDQFKKILKKYYPKRIHVIGCLKNDMINFKKKYSSKNFKQNNKKKILVAPSIGDEETILMYLKEFALKNQKLLQEFDFYLSPHPGNKQKTIKLFKRKLSEIKFSLTKESSFVKMQSCDLVICNLSNIAYEATIMGVPAIRVADTTKPLLFHLKDNIKKIYDNRSFAKELKKKKFFLADRKRIIEYFFYKLDNDAYKRFWKALN